MHNVRILIAIATCCFLAGCPAQPPATQRARTPAQFVKKLATVIPRDTDITTAIHTLRYREGIRGKEVKSGDFVANEGTPNEKTHKSIHFIEFERTFATTNDEWQTVKIAMVFEKGKFSRCLTKVVKTEPKPKPNSSK